MLGTTYYEHVMFTNERWFYVPLTGFADSNPRGDLTIVSSQIENGF